MRTTRELRLFLRRTSDGAFRLEADDGNLLMENRSYRQLRRDLDTLLRVLPGSPPVVKILLGAPVRRPSPRPESGVFAPVTLPS